MVVISITRNEFVKVINNFCLAVKPFSFLVQKLNLILQEYLTHVPRVKSN